MDISQSVIVALRASVFLTVFAVGLGATGKDVTRLLRSPKVLIRSLTAMHVVMPATAIFLWWAFDLEPFFGVALVALSLSPVPPLFPHKALGAHGGRHYALSMLVTTALLTVVLLPVTAAILPRAIDGAPQISVVTVASAAMLSVLVPLTTGAMVRSFLPRFAARLETPVQVVSLVIFSGCTLLIVMGSWDAVTALARQGDVVALVLFVATGLVVGHVLGGPKEEDRTVLALATAGRHPGVAIGVGGATVADGHFVALMLLYLLASTAMSVPYIVWRRRAVTASGGTPPASPADADELFRMGSGLAP